MVRKYILKRHLRHHRTGRLVSLKSSDRRSLTRLRNMVPAKFLPVVPKRITQGLPVREALRRRTQYLLLNKPNTWTRERGYTRVRLDNPLRDLQKAPLFNLFQNPVKAHAHCVKRKIRRSVLYALGIAGTGKRRSPGQGGTYKRTEESSLSC